MNIFLHEVQNFPFSERIINCHFSWQGWGMEMLILFFIVLKITKKQSRSQYDNLFYKKIPAIENCRDL